MLLTFASWTEAFVYDLKDYLNPSDCTPVGCDLDSAFLDVMAACEISRTSTVYPSSHVEAGCKMKIPAGAHTISQSIATGSDPGICRAYSFEGCGGLSNRVVHYRE